ncbi:MAG TPA: ABC transporter ATP-binding protein [Terriglobales bacterium]|nr:ABC transporter ATP-binding protein [Terriglobales bacterium]
MAVVRVEHARKSFGKTEALVDASLELREGELLGLLGPNGAGKTTLVRALAGRVSLDGGAMELYGRPLSGTGRRDGLGIVPQEIALYPLLTARENLEAFGSFNGLRGSALREKVDWALDWTGLAERSREPIRRFSGGMKRRLNIACGVLHDPRVILLDEPTVGVDPQSRERIYEMLDRLRAGGASLLLTTHQLEEAEARCERITILDHGRGIESGTLAELVARTVGPARVVTLRLDRAPARPIEGLAATDEPATFRGQVGNVDADLAALLARVGAAGCVVRDLEVRHPSLQSVFLHLTGRELRE